jgi:hypothetical protein
MPAANVNKEFHVLGEPTPQSLRDNDKAIILAVAEIYSNKNLALNCRTFTVTATLDITDVVALCDTTAGAITLTLTAANSGSSRDVAKTKLLIVNNVAGANNVTLSRAGTDTIGGGTTLVIVPGGYAYLWSDGNSKWLILDRYERVAFAPTDTSGAALALTDHGSFYIRQGNIVTANVYTTYPATGSGLVAQLGGFPYAPVILTTSPVFSSAAANPTATQFAGLNAMNIIAAGAALTNAQMTGAFFATSISYIV